MPTPLPPAYYARQAQFRQAELAGQAFSPAQLDGELDALLRSVNQSILVLRQIVDASGRLRLQQPLREMQLVETLAYIATAAQTVFYVAPITDVLTDRAEVSFNTTGDLYSTVTQSKVALAAAVPSGTVTATLGSAIYNFSATLPAVVTNARLVVNGTDAGRVTSRLSNTQLQTDTPWPLANIAGTTFTWQYLATATLSGVTPALTAGQKVQIALFTDGAGALSQLGAAGPSTGARQVAVYDVGGLIAAGNVEDALQELAQQIVAVTTLFGPVAGFLKADGTVPMTGDLAAGGFKGTGFAPGTATGELVIWDQVSAAITVWNNLQQFYLKRDGSTAMTGDLPMGQHRTINQAAGVNPDDGAIKSQVDERIHKNGSVAMTGDLNLNAHKITALADGTALQDAVTVRQLQDTQTGSVSVFQFATPGVWSWVVPAGVSRVDILAWSGGAPGSAAQGGAAGGFLKVRLAVTGGDILSGDIGVAGTGVANGGTTTIKLGATTIFQVTGAAAGSSGLGGVPSALTGLQFFGIQGGRGATATTANDGGGTQYGSADGRDAPWGGPGGQSQRVSNTGLALASSAGLWPGGGGGATSSDGAAGGVVITY